MPADLKRFRDITMGKPVIMGRKTFLSISRELKGRKMIILTRDKNFSAPKYATVAHSVNEALAVAGFAPEVMVIGGADIFKQFMDLADRLYLTVIYGKFEGDAHFPKVDRFEWIEKEKQTYKADRENPYNYMFLILERSN